MASIAGQVVEKVNPNTGLAEKYRVVEFPVDPPNTVIRRLVPIETTDEDIPEGSRLMGKLESQGILERQSAPDRLFVGDRVRLRSAIGSNETPIDGTIDAKLKTGKFRVRFENGQSGRYEAVELVKVY